ncbi:hypothetical protein GCM10022255_041830 [Dactylosporangium darangshiense]|uniref:Uncharacterized protein n=1 Tax=Dactylosporangium darangshiense TaxID=579108 RepID=A0ABP8DA24_9ACTN
MCAAGLLSGVQLASSGVPYVTLETGRVAPPARGSCRDRREERVVRTKRITTMATAIRMIGITAYSGTARTVAHART